MLRRLVVIFVALSMVATACGEGSTENTEIVEATPNIATTTAIPMPTEVEPTATAIPTVTATATPQPAPTPTVAPTVTPEPLPTATPEPVEAPTPEPTLAPEAADSATDAAAISGGEAEEASDGAAGENAATTAAQSGPKPAGQGVLPVAYDMSSIQAVACPQGADNAAVTCYFAQTPVNADNPSPNSMIDLMVSVIDNGDPFNVGPVFYLQGGPGVGNVQFSNRYVGLDHDVVLIDQRGTGSSVPKLGCDEVDALWVSERTNDSATRLTDVAGAVVIVDAYAACADRLRTSGVDLNLFDTTNAADDFALVRQLLGYPTWSLWGISYGTRLGLTIMRDHPEGVRAAVLDSTVPFEVDFFAEIPANGLRAMTAVSQACNATSCGTEHGDFLTNLGALSQRLDTDPIVLTVTRPSSGTQFDYRVTGKELLAMVFTQLYSTDRLRALPRQIARADFGGIEEIVGAYVARRDPEALDLALGAYYATWCSEEYPFYDNTTDDDLLIEAYVQFGAGFAPALSSDGVANVCSKFQVRRADSVDNQRFTSSIPTLVMAGAFDPITPPAWSEQVADAMTNSYYIELADHGHGMTGSCTAGIRLQFLINPNVAPDPGCANAVAGPTFE